VANRPTLRALEQAHAIAIGAGDMHSAAELMTQAVRRWGDTGAFASSKLAGYHLERPASHLDQIDRQLL
jgi:hypothetical protein